MIVLKKMKAKLCWIKDKCKKKMKKEVYYVLSIICFIFFYFNESF